MKPTDFIMMPIPADRYTDVCALLGGAASAALSLGNQLRVVRTEDNAKQDTGPSSGGNETPAPANQESVGTGPDATNDASPSDGEVDAHGHPWSPDLHASTKGKTKDGLWRMKVGVTRPDPKPGFPAADTGTSSGTPTPSATSQDAAGEASGQPATSTVEEDDEFAAFRKAAETSNATDQTAVAGVPARQYSDADLGALCNQAAVKLGDPTPVKGIIAKYTPEGSVAHSRNIPAEQRAHFVGEVEAAAGIQFAG